MVWDSSCYYQLESSKQVLKLITTTRLKLPVCWNALLLPCFNTNRDVIYAYFTYRDVGYKYLPLMLGAVLGISSVD